MVTIEKKDVKSILNKMKCVDSWFWCRYTLNPYQGCEHACTYCDARSHKYHIHENIDQKVVVKSNAAQLLEEKFRRSKQFPDVIGFGGVCDAYQPVEKEIKQTQSILKIIEKYSWPVHLITKSPLVTRDGPIYNSIAKKSWATVSFTITTTDKTIGSFLEPEVVPAQERFNAITQFKEKWPAVQTGVMFMPIVPFLEDSVKNIESVISGAKEAGADFVLFSPGMTMRDNQALWFMQRIAEEYPELIPKYEALYSFKYNTKNYTGTYTPKSAYLKKIGLLATKMLKKYKMPPRVKRYIPNDYRRINYTLAAELFMKAYNAMISEKPKGAYNKAGFAIQNLKESIVDVVEKKQLNTLPLTKEIEYYIRERLPHFRKDQARLFDFA